MPLVAHNDLPTFDRLRAEGIRVLPADRALHQDIRELHIGLLNMMPDAALPVNSMNSEEPLSRTRTIDVAICTSDRAMWNSANRTAPRSAKILAL